MGQSSKQVDCMDLKESQNWRDSLWHRISMRLYTEEHGKKSLCLVLRESKSESTSNCVLLRCLNNIITDISKYQMLIDSRKKGNQCYDKLTRQILKLD